MASGAYKNDILGDFVFKQMYSGVVIISFVILSSFNILIFGFADLCHILHLVLFEKMMKTLEDIGKTPSPTDWASICALTTATSTSMTLHSDHKSVDDQMSDLTSCGAPSSPRGPPPSLADLILIGKEEAQRTSSPTMQATVSAIIRDDLESSCPHIEYVEKAFRKYFTNVESFRAEKLLHVLDCPMIANLLYFVENLNPIHGNDFAVLESLEGYDYIEEHKHDTMLQVIKFINSKKIVFISFNFPTYLSKGSGKEI